jgi:hypothetical protein
LAGSDPVVVALERLIALLEAKFELNSPAPAADAPAVTSAAVSVPVIDPPAPPIVPATPKSAFHLTPMTDRAPEPAQTLSAQPLHRRRAIRTLCLIGLLTAASAQPVSPDRTFVAAAAARRDYVPPRAQVASVQLALMEPTPKPSLPADPPAPTAVPVSATLAAPAEPQPKPVEPAVASTPDPTAGADEAFDPLPVTKIDPGAWDARLAALLARRGDGMIAKRDILGARKFYEYAANAGSARAAMVLARTYNPDYLASARVVGPLPDPDMERFWTQRAAQLVGGGPLTPTQLASLAAPPRPASPRHHTVRTRSAETTPAPASE